jgi:hypothetical protein
MCGEVVLFGSVVILICMNDWKENLTESINNAYERRSNHLWIKIFMYVIIVFIAFIFTRMLIHFNIFYIESDSAEYLLSALVQSEAAIIGIVITLTFIAVQLIFSYAPQAVAVALKKNYDMWLLLIFYAISIFYGLFVLRMIPNEWNGSLGQLYFSTLWGSPVSLEYRICFAYCLGVSAFVAIAPYILNTVYFLKPANIIKILSRDITEYKILRHIKSVEEYKKDRTISVKEDPVQPIMSIIHGSVMKYDITTVRCGLEAVIKKAVDIIDIYKYSDDDEDIPMYFCDHLERAGRYAMRAGDDESAIEIIGCLKNIAILAIEMPSDKAVKIAAQYIEMIGTFAAERRLRFVTCDALASLNEVGTLTAENGLEDATVQVIDSLGNVGMYAADNKIGIAAQDAAKYLGHVGKCAAENELENAAKQAADSLGVVGNYATENKLKYATLEAAFSLRVVGMTAAGNGLEDAAKAAAAALGVVGNAAVEKKLEDAAKAAAESLGVVGKAFAEKRLGDASMQAARSLTSIGTYAIENELGGVARQVAKSLKNVGIAAVENKLGRVATKAVWTLEHVGKSAAERELEDAVGQTTWSLVDVGISATENRLEEVTEQAARSLAELTILSEELVETAIQWLEQEEQDRDALRKFMNIYEHELKKLRTRNSN